MGRFWRRQAIGRPSLSHSLIFFTPSLIACSFFAPTLHEYSSGSGGGAGQSGQSDGQSAGNSGSPTSGGDAGSGGAGATNGGSASGGAGGTIGGTGGMGTAPVQVIVGEQSSRCLDTNGGQTTANTPCELNDCTAADANQGWIFVQGELQLAADPTQCLQVDGPFVQATPVDTAPCAGSDAQKWVVPSSASFGHNDSVPGLCLDARQRNWQRYEDRGWHLQRRGESILMPGAAPAL